MIKRFERCAKARDDRAPLWLEFQLSGAIMTDHTDRKTKENPFRQKWPPEESSFLPKVAYVSAEENQQSSTTLLCSPKFHVLHTDIVTI